MVEQIPLSIRRQQQLEQLKKRFDNPEACVSLPISLLCRLLQIAPSTLAREFDGQTSLPEDPNHAGYFLLTGENYRSLKEHFQTQTK